MVGLGNLGGRLLGLGYLDLVRWVLLGRVLLGWALLVVYGGGVVVCGDVVVWVDDDGGSEVWGGPVDSEGLLVEGDVEISDEVGRRKGLVGRGMCLDRRVDVVG